MFIHKPDVGKLAMVRQLAAEQRAWAGEFVGLRKDGSTFPVEASMSSLPDGTNIYITRDITVRKAAEIERDRLRHQFFQSQKMEAIGVLAGGIAHDFNNILAAIQGYASFLTEDLAEGSPERRFADQIMIATERAKLLVQQILTFFLSSGRRESAG